MKIHHIERDSSAFQRPVHEQDLLQTLKQELKGEEVIEVTEISGGLFNNTYRVTTSDATYILKVAPHKTSTVFYNERFLMQRERSISRQLQAVNPLIPTYLSFFTVGGRSAFLQSFVQGRLWHDVESTLSKEENAALWRQLGTFARTVHNTCSDTFGYPEPFEGAAQWSTFIVENVEGMVDNCRRLGVLHDEVLTYLDLLPHFLLVLDEVKTAHLLHGDLWPRNVIINGDGANIHIAAVIDAERAFWGDPLCDWVLILYGVPKAFWIGYGEDLVKTGSLVRIAVYKGMYAILGVLEAARSGESVDPSRKRLARINSELRGYV